MIVASAAQLPLALPRHSGVVVCVERSVHNTTRRLFPCRFEIRSNTRSLPARSGYRRKVGVRRMYLRDYVHLMVRAQLLFKRVCPKNWESRAVALLSPYRQPWSSNSTVPGRFVFESNERSREQYGIDIVIVEGARGCRN